MSPIGFADTVDKDPVVPVYDLARLDHQRLRLGKSHQHHAVRDLMAHVVGIVQAEEREESGWGRGAGTRLPGRGLVKIGQIILRA